MKKKNLKVFWKIWYYYIFIKSIWNFYWVKGKCILESNRLFIVELKLLVKICIYIKD